MKFIVKKALFFLLLTFAVQTHMAKCDSKIAFGIATFETAIEVGSAALITSIMIEQAQSPEETLSRYYVTGVAGLSYLFLQLGKKAVKLYRYAKQKKYKT